MPKMVDRTGHRYGRLLVLEQAESYKRPTGKTRVRWRCQCDCGRTLDVLGDSLKAGNTKSCGCLSTENRANVHRTHGRSKTPEYRAWKAMRTRCNNPRATGYENYGGRGITVDPSWDDFEVFLRDMGLMPGPGYSLDREDNDKGYSAANCRWATRAQQNRNTRRNVWVDCGGTFLTMTDAAQSYGLHRDALRWRIDNGWEKDRLLSPSTKPSRLVQQ